jgi:hypothetical protein
MIQECTVPWPHVVEPCSSLGSWRLVQSLCIERDCILTQGTLYCDSQPIESQTKLSSSFKTNRITNETFMQFQNQSKPHERFAHDSKRFPAPDSVPFNPGISRCTSVRCGAAQVALTASVRSFVNPPSPSRTASWNRFCPIT